MPEPAWMAENSLSDAYAEIKRLQKLISDVAVHVRPGDLPPALFYRLTAQALTPEKRREGRPAHVDYEEHAPLSPTPYKHRDEIGYVPKDDPRLNTIIGPPRLPDKRRKE